MQKPLVALLATLCSAAAAGQDPPQSVAFRLELRLVGGIEIQIARLLQQVFEQHRQRSIRSLLTELLHEGAESLQCLGAAARKAGQLGVT